MKSSNILLTLAASALSLSGQSTFSGPASGYVFDSVERSIRAIVGIPGAAYLGSQTGSPPLAPWDSVSVAPNGKRALGVRGLSVNLIPDLTQPASAASITQATGPISRIVWSADSTTAAIWVPAAGQLQRITGLDSAPVVHDAIDLDRARRSPVRMEFEPGWPLRSLIKSGFGNGFCLPLRSGRSPCFDWILWPIPEQSLSRWMAHRFLFSIAPRVRSSSLPCPQGPSVAASTQARSMPPGERRLPGAGFGEHSRAGYRLRPGSGIWRLRRMARGSMPSAVRRCAVTIFRLGSCRRAAISISLPVRSSRCRVGSCC